MSQWLLQGSFNFHFCTSFEILSLNANTHTRANVRKITFSEKLLSHIASQDTQLVLTSSFNDAVKITVKGPGELHIVSLYDRPIVYIHWTPLCSQDHSKDQSRKKDACENK